MEKVGVGDGGKMEQKGERERIMREGENLEMIGLEGLLCKGLLMAGKRDQPYIGYPPQQLMGFRIYSKQKLFVDNAQ